MSFDDGGISINAGGGANWHVVEEKPQEETQLEKFESIFNRLDENGDGTIDDTDNLSRYERTLADKLKSVFEELQQVLNTTFEFSMQGINSMLNKFKGTILENDINQHLIQDIIEEDEKMNDDPFYRHEKAQEVFNELDKNGDGVINESDPLSEEEQAQLDEIKGEFSYQIQHTQKGKFNGVDADITYGANNQIIKVKTSATNAKDAARLMGLDRYYYCGSTPFYYHEVLNKQGKVINRDCYSWDEGSQAMIWECGAGGGDENSGGFGRINDYHKSY